VSQKINVERFYAEKMAELKQEYEELEKKSEER